MMIKAIDTKYAGRLFRSRLEARWAVFFDHLHFNWSYEEEGYQMDGIKYLPDFCIRVRGQKIYAEVKPEEFTSAERAKCALLAQNTNCSVLLLPGPPAPVCYEVTHGDGLSSVAVITDSDKYAPLHWEPADPGDPIVNIKYFDTTLLAVEQALSKRFEFL